MKKTFKILGTAISFLLIIVILTLSARKSIAPAQTQDIQALTKTSDEESNDTIKVSVVPIEDLAIPEPEPESEPEPEPEPEPSPQKETKDIVKAPAEEDSTDDSELFRTPWGSVYTFVVPSDFVHYGVFYWHGYKWTWYSERVLPGPGLRIPGRWSDTYFVRDQDNNICLASSDLSWGTYVMTPWGQGRVYDCGCAHGTIDVYVTW